MVKNKAERTANSKKAVAYIRVSTLEQVKEGVSLQDQENKIRAYCIAAGLELVEMVKEEGVSGAKKINRRPAGQRLLAALIESKASHVVALKLDRLFRNSADALTVTEDWNREGIALHLVDFGGQSLNTASAVGRMFITMLAAMSEFERALIRERTLSAMQFKKAKRDIYSPVPMGFQRGQGKALTEDKAEQALIASIKAAHAAGASFNAIAAGLNRQGTQGKRGGAFYASTIRHIINNTLYA